MPETERHITIERDETGMPAKMFIGTRPKPPPQPKPEKFKPMPPVLTRGGREIGGMEKS